MTKLAKSLISSSVSEYIPTHVDNNKGPKPIVSGDNWSDQNSLPEPIYDSFLRKSNGLDIKFSLQTIAKS